MFDWVKVEVQLIWNILLSFVRPHVFCFYFIYVADSPTEEGEMLFDLCIFKSEQAFPVEHDGPGLGNQWFKLHISCSLLLWTSCIRHYHSPFQNNVWTSLNPCAVHFLQQILHCQYRDMEYNLYIHQERFGGNAFVLYEIYFHVIMGHVILVSIQLNTSVTSLSSHGCT